MKKALFLAAVLAAGLASALTPEEKAAQERERAEIKASEEAWKALRKEAEDLAQQDFKGGFADYWHDRIDAARELLDASLTNAVFRNRQRIDICRQMAQYRLESTRDEAGALAEVERPFAFEGLSDDDMAEAANNVRRGVPMATPAIPMWKANTSNALAAMLMMFWAMDTHIGTRVFCIPTSHPVST